MELDFAISAPENRYFVSILFFIYRFFFLLFLHVGIIGDKWRNLRLPLLIDGFYRLIIIFIDEIIGFGVLLVLLRKIYGLYLFIGKKGLPSFDPLIHILNILLDIFSRFVFSGLQEKVLTRFLLKFRIVFVLN